VFIEYVRGIFYKPGFITTIKLLLRRTLVLKNKLWAISFELQVVCS